MYQNCFSLALHRVDESENRMGNLVSKMIAVCCYRYENILGWYIFLWLMAAVTYWGKIVFQIKNQGVS